MRLEDRRIRLEYWTNQGKKPPDVIYVLRIDYGKGNYVEREHVQKKSTLREAEEQLSKDVLSVSIIKTITKRKGSK